jgi:citrate synthase
MQTDRINNRDDGLVPREDALDRLQVKAATLYTYVSRGWIRRVKQGRRSLYVAADVDALVTRRRARAGHTAAASSALRWGEPVLDSAVTRITDGQIAHRGYPQDRLVDLRWESVATLLWTGALPPLPPTWTARPIDLPPGRALRRLRALFLALDGPEPQDTLAWAGALLRSAVQVFGADSPGPVVPALARALGAPQDAVQTALIACADHGLTTSTFVARLTASSGASLAACVSAALACLSGGRHGGACDVLEGQAPAPPTSLPVGFGHRLHPSGDPRAAPLLQWATPAFRAWAHSGPVPPTVDTGLVGLCKGLDLPPGTATGLFAMGRLVGLIAHVLEQRQHDLILRPRARYAP